jgi:hypothetical protein
MARKNMIWAKAISHQRGNERKKLVA